MVENSESNPDDPSPDAANPIEPSTVADTEVTVVGSESIPPSDLAETSYAIVIRPSPPRFWWFIGTVLYTIAALFVTVPFGMAAWDYWQMPFNTRDDFSQTFSQRLQYRYLEAFVAVWFFSLGASVGSFLNVVVYRWPRNRSVVLRPSHCPQCDGRIRAADNIPIVGWFRLRAACRQCHLPIASRYPAIELLVGTVFFVFYFVELISGGMNLPVRMPNLYKGMLWTVFYPKWDLILIYAFHMYLVCLVLAWFLMQFDHQRFPIGRLTLCILSLITFSAIIPDVQPQPWSTQALWNLDLPDWLDAAMVSSTGAVAGIMVGAVLTRLLLQQRRGWQDFGGLVLIGAGLGWRAVLWIGCLATISCLLINLVGGKGRQPDSTPPESRELNDRDWYWSAGLWCWLVVFLVGWRTLWFYTGAT